MEREKLQLMEPYLKAAFETPPFSFVLMGNITAAMKPQLLSKEYKDFPVITLTGAPGSGKTSIARACMTGCEKEYLFTDKVSSVKKELSRKEMQNRYILLDDCAAFASQSAKQKASTFLDEVVRGSYNGSLPLMLVTVEEKALGHITQSCRTRLLEVPVDNVLKDERLTAVLDYLQQNRKMVCELFGEFNQWYEKHCSKYDFSILLKDFHEKYRGKDARSTSLFFIYTVSMGIFNDFLGEACDLKISMSKINENCTLLWERRESSTLSRMELVKMLFQALIDDGAFRPSEPRPRNLCSEFCDGKCTEFDRDGGPYCDNCFCTTVKCDYYYDPRDLLLGGETGSAILIESGRYIYQYPKYCDGKTPLLIVRDEELLSFMNDELQKYCCEKKIHLAWLGPKELHKILFESNKCMYRFISNEHKTYVFKYDSLGKENESVMILRLTQEQYDSLRSQTKPSMGSIFADVNTVKSLCRKLRAIGYSIHGMAGE